MAVVDGQAFELLLEPRRFYKEVLLLEPRRFYKEVLIFSDEEAHPLGCGHLQARALALAHALEEPCRNLQLADLLALGLDMDGPAGIEALESVPHQAIEHLLRRLRLAGQVPQQGAAMAGEPLEVEHLRAPRRQRFQQPALAAAGGAAQHPEAKSSRKLVELRHDFAPIRPVTALQRRGVPA